MFTEILKHLKPGLLLFVFFTILTGVIYPASITLLSHALFPWQANGSLVTRHNQPVGSLLIGQEFTAPYYFNGRPSATTPFGYNAENSSGSNLGPLNPKLLRDVHDRVIQLRTAHTAYHKGNAENLLIPIELVTTSASGLDPDISPAAARYQIPRIAKFRGIAPELLEQWTQQWVQPPTLGFLGQDRLNVLQLNLALDQQFPLKSAP